MFFSKKQTAEDLGVPLKDLEVVLRPTSVRVKRTPMAIAADHGNYTMRLEVLPPPSGQMGNDRVQAFVTITTEIPEPLTQILDSEQAAVAMNSFAALSAFTFAERRVTICSRLTVYEGESAWKTLHLPLLMFNILCSTEALFGGMRRTFNEQQPAKGSSKWGQADFVQVRDALSRHCVCFADSKGFSAEFGLVAGATSAATHPGKTAFLQLQTDQPHPELGGGLFCLLQLPFGFRDSAEATRLANLLNVREQECRDLVPHFGAWTTGADHTGLAYVSFLPNPMHDIPGRALNYAIWSRNRSEWATSVLSGEGYSL